MTDFFGLGVAKKQFSTFRDKSVNGHENIRFLQNFIYVLRYGSYRKNIVFSSLGGVSEPVSNVNFDGVPCLSFFKTETIRSGTLAYYGNVRKFHPPL
jgi:hypothetical protein